MTDGTTEFTKLEELVKQRRDELALGRSAKPDRTALGSSALTTEERLLEEVQNRLLAERLDQEQVRSRSEAVAHRERLLGTISLWVSWLAPAAAILVILVFDDLVMKVRVLAGSAAALGAIAAFIRLAAHRGSQALDGLGKALGFVAALLAAFATIALLALIA